VAHIKIVPDLCTACKACEIACAERHSKSGRYPESIWETPRPVPRVKIVYKGPKMHAIRCFHCRKPTCLEACEEDAISKVDGKVLIDLDKCNGCWSCVDACPFGSIQKDEDCEVAVKCDLCLGYDDQACIISCPTDALMYFEVKKS
jgi:carbon-monoxide dehydrogenase iron sulfur subunit